MFCIAKAARLCMLTLSLALGFAPSWLGEIAIQETQFAAQGTLMKSSFSDSRMGSTGDPPVPVGDPPTGTSQASPSIWPSSLAGDALPVPSGESPDGTGQWSVLPITQFPNTRLDT